MSVTHAIQVELRCLPWSAGPCDAPRVPGGRPSLLVPSNGETREVDGLPQTAVRDAPEGHAWRRFELPATGAESEQGPVTETLPPSLTGQSLEIILEGGLPRPSAKRFLVASETQAPSTDPWHVAGAAAYFLVGQHVELVNRLLEQTRWGPQDTWSGKAGLVVARSLEAVLDAWSQLASQDEPQMALIVRLARELGPVLQDVCRRPRRVLARQRQSLNAGKVQELDATCIRWLARQPGRSVVEKAGTSQRILGVVRIEDTDTPENRVVRDLICRAIVACIRYRIEYRSFRDSDRFRLVGRFLRLLRELRSCSAISSVRELSGIATPNYVLQHDPRYRILWQSYVLLVRQQMQQDQAWRWRHRIWAEECLLAVLAAMRSIQPAGVALRSDIWLHAEHVHGRFIDSCTALGPWGLMHSAEQVAIDFVRGEDLTRYAQVIAIPESLGELAPDAILVRRSLSHPERPPRILGLWAILDFGVDDDLLAEHTQQLNERLACICGATRVHGLLLQPQRLVGLPAEPCLVQADRCTGGRLTHVLQEHVALLATLVRQGLHLT